jgi:hypothetical protein
MVPTIKSFLALILLATTTAVDAFPSQLMSARQTTSACACGFVDDQGHVWRESLISDFTTSAGALAGLREGTDWIIATDNEPQPTGIAIQYTTGNVFDNGGALGIKASAVSLATIMIRLTVSVNDE